MAVRKRTDSGPRPPPHTPPAFLLRGRVPAAFSFLFCFSTYLASTADRRSSYRGTPRPGRSAAVITLDLGCLVPPQAQRGSGQAALPGQQRQSQHRLAPGSALPAPGSTR
ncbi:hypothetical protein NDU88_003984 [Pleurodeles waltl]|uniref:Uncharacterized protein n=1 Tax=Pleurodeles waltl TaxID=8319 RepID=A0AAV7PB50_PLEWA|nr:hypothetical protein NDU88_003984 [Pleurodeles waltl]